MSVVVSVGMLSSDVVVIVVTSRSVVGGQSSVAKVVQSSVERLVQSKPSSVEVELLVMTEKVPVECDVHFSRVDEAVAVAVGSKGHDSEDDDRDDELDWGPSTGSLDESSDPQSPVNCPMP